MQSEAVLLNGQLQSGTRPSPMIFWMRMVEPRTVRRKYQRSAGFENAPYFGEIGAKIAHMFKDLDGKYDIEGRIGQRKPSVWRYSDICALRKISSAVVCASSQNERLVGLITAAEIEHLLSAAKMVGHELTDDFGHAPKHQPIGVPNSGAQSPWFHDQRSTGQCSATNRASCPPITATRNPPSAVCMPTTPSTAAASNGRVVGRAA